MVLIVSIAMLAALLVLILKNKFLPGNILALLPLIAAMVIGTGLEQTMMLAHGGIEDVTPIVVMYIFAVIYFGVMSDAGMFEPIINRLLKVKWVGKSVFSVVVITSLIAMVTHMDGQGMTTLIITVPPMLIVFDKLKIRRTMMAMTFVLVVGSMNILPWAGPVARAATVINVDVMELWKKLLPIQITALALSFVALFFASRAEQKRGEFVPSAGAAEGVIEISPEAKALRRPKLFWFNLLFTIVLLAALFIGLPPHIGFLIGCAVVLPVNYRSLKEQNARVKSYAGNLLVQAYTIIGAGILLGIMEGTGMFTVLANAIVAIVPDSLDKISHIIFGLLVTPLSFLLNTDAMIYGIMPVVVNVGAQTGVPAATIVGMFVAGRVIGTGLCLTTASTYLALGLMGLDYKEAFKAVFKWSLLLGTVLVLLAAVIVR
jgi:CitMHS family citrate-Mg2+:H+ or citrate-Ca2+:H+ symporter